MPHRNKWLEWPYPPSSHSNKWLEWSQVYSTVRNQLPGMTTPTSKRIWDQNRLLLHSPRIRCVLLSNFMSTDFTWITTPTKPHPYKVDTLLEQLGTHVLSQTPGSVSRVPPPWFLQGPRPQTPCVLAAADPYQSSAWHTLDQSTDTRWILQRALQHYSLQPTFLPSK